ncbi:glycosyltransferase family 1 protein [Algoriphagus sp.]|uniref:glycosyltransferase family 4 protein n=1 Tax=Algoriphagus sp. TaxID=1872435 RepID=UPI002719ECB5|nr:glycosyltransferase family 1 protein [Algoriphagus sp.]MDO8965703.1 glycosyltransferase family 1 protein [Algoriphagus sp.]MDP3202396.1 glycosyltransferase family 1 protein [Algoriphagus sp.]
MKVLVYGDIGGSGGYYRYCKGLFSSGVIPEDILVYFITSESFHEKLGDLDHNVQVIKHNWIDSPSRFKRYMWHLWVYPRLVRKLNPDLEFYSNGQLRVYMRNALTVATCHNLLLFDNFELNRVLNVDEKIYFLKTRKRQVKSFKRSDALIFLSQHSKNVILPEIDCNKTNRIISHGLDSKFFLNNVRNFTINQEVKILYVSPIFHYKNHLNVVQAIHKLNEELDLNIHLNLVGGGDSSALNELLNYISNNQLDNSITIKQFVDTNGLLSEYISNDIFLFASSSETFGITLLEAMGAKLPIACSNQTGLPDILKDAGVYFDPFDVLSIVSALKELILNPIKREELGKKAFEYAHLYTWEKCAKDTFEFLRSVYNESLKKIN